MGKRITVSSPQFLDPHTPYDCLISYGNSFENEPINSWITTDLVRPQNQSFGPSRANEVPGYNS